MKKLVLLSFAAIACVSCSHDFGNYGEAYIDSSTLQDKDPNEVTKEDIQANVANIFGTIDPEQDWNLITSGTITITADAPLSDIVKVQVLTESPFMNPTTEILCEAEVQQGGQVTLNYEAPNEYSRLIAACVSKDGHYYIKGFNTNETTVSFSSPNMARSFTRTVESYPQLEKIKLEWKNSLQSSNALRTIYANEAAAGDETKKEYVRNNNLGVWQGSGWEKDRIWQFSEDNSIANDGWECLNRTLAHSISGGITPKEEEELSDIIGKYQQRIRTNNIMTDNMKYIRDSKLFTMYNNHLIATGDPVIITPVQMPSKDAKDCWLGYYYYDPNDLANSGLSLKDYIKRLPKFKAIQFSSVINKAGINTDNTRQNFFKVYEYLLPYFGKPEKFTDITGKTEVMCIPDAPLYRLRNGEKFKGEDYYLTYIDNQDDKDIFMRDKLSTRYDDNAENIANQLWQIYRSPEGYVMLYNVGCGEFLTPYQNQGYSVFESNMDRVKKTYVVEEKLSNGAYRFARGTDKNKFIGTDLNKKTGFRVSTDKNNNDGARAQWYVEPYESTAISTIGEPFVWEEKNFETYAEAISIPAGFRIGFFIHKGNNTSINAVNTGELYGVEGLNREINQFPGHFGSSVTTYSMDIDDPRIAMFEANGKMYMTFEDGSDASFGDLILEVPSGVEQVPDEYGISYISYTMCFEDSPIADYDMNDAVLKFSRIDPTHVKVSLVACGAYDELYLRGLNGSKLNETTEIHDIFGAAKGSFINTDNNHVAPPVEEVFEITAESRLSDFIEGIYIYDKTKDCNIYLAASGDDPHAIVIPSDFDYPKEKNCISSAYPLFNNWAQNANNDRFWFRHAVEQLIYKK